MKIIHIQASVQNSSNAPYRLHAAMLSAGLKSSMLVLSTTKSNSKDFFRIGALKKNITMYSYALMMHFIRQKIIKYPHLFSFPFFVGNDIAEHHLIKSADVIYLHWINNGFLNINNIRKILRLGKPTIMFMHDMWFITGGCHHSFDCDGYKSLCDNCPMFDESMRINFTSYQLRQKKKLYVEYNNLHFVSPSQWMAECARQANVAKHKKIHIIPNIINEVIYKGLDKKYSKQILNLDTEKKVISFGCVAGFNNPIKGWNYLLAALILLKDFYLVDDIQLLIFGAEYDDHAEKQCPYPIKFLGTINDEIFMSLISNASDVFVTPSLAESFGMTALESIFCGTPVVAFDNGGVVDFLKHNTNGYLGRYKSSEDIAHGIHYCLKNKLPMTVSSEFYTSRVMDKHKKLISHVTGKLL